MILICIIINLITIKYEGEENSEKNGNCTVVMMEK